MSEEKDRGKEKRGRSRVFFAVLGVICPGLGQIARGRIFAGLLFLLNVILYFIPVFVPHNLEYDVRTPSVLIALGVWICSPLDACLQRSSFLVLALLVSLLSFGSGFFSAYYIIPHLDV